MRHLSGQDTATGIMSGLIGGLEMSEMVEQVAAACQTADQKFRKENGPAADYAKRCYEAIADAAIKAMREPTSEQENIFYAMRIKLGDSRSEACLNVSRWELGIDAALSELTSSVPVAKS